MENRSVLNEIFEQGGGQGGFKGRQTRNLIPLKGALSDVSNTPREDTGDFSSILALLEEEEGDEASNPNGKERQGSTGGVAKISNQTLSSTAETQQHKFKKVNTTLFQGTARNEECVELYEANSRLRMNLCKLEISPGGIEGTCFQPFREYKVKYVVESVRGLQREKCLLVRYSHARKILFDQFGTRVKQCGLTDAFRKSLESFPSKSRTKSTALAFAMDRAKQLQAYVVQLLLRLKQLYEDAVEKNDEKMRESAQALQSVIVREFLQIDIDEVSKSVILLESVVLGLK